MIRTWTDRELDDLFLALLELPQLGYYLERHGFGLKIKQIKEKRLKQAEKHLKKVKKWKRNKYVPYVEMNL